MKLFLVTVFLLAGAPIATNAQSCLTQDDLRLMLARVEAPAQKPDKKLKAELLKLASKQRELLLEVVSNDEAKASDQRKLQKLFESHSVKLCEMLKTYGWPTSALVDREGVVAAFLILKNSGTYELQRDLLPVIVAVIKKDPSQKSDFAALYDRLRVSAGMKQLFGTQAVTSDGFLVLYPIENPAKVDALRAEFGLPKLDLYIRALQQNYGKPLVKARQPPSSQHSKQLTESLTQTINSAQLDSPDVDPDDVIKTETNLVSLNVSVFNNKSKMFIGSLTKEDFRVLENDQEQTVTYFASTDVPFDLVLLIDLSGSTKETRSDQEVDAAVHRSSASGGPARHRHLF